MTMKFEEKPEDKGSLAGRSRSWLHLDGIHQANGKPIANGKTDTYEKQEANGKSHGLRKSLNTYTWQEIQRHNQETDQWLVINRKVYNVTDWASRHPGGHRVLNHYAGEDATVRNSKTPKSISLPPSLFFLLPPSQLLGG